MLSQLLLMEKVDDYTKIDYSIPKVNKEDYITFKEYFQARSNYVQLKFKDTYGSKESSS